MFLHALPFYCKPTRKDKINKTGNVHIYVTLSHVGVTNVALERQYVSHIMGVCRLSYAACKAHSPYWVIICDMSDSTMFFHIIS
jgi:hypothetical protein